MTTLLDLSDDIFVMVFHYIDIDTIRSLRLTHTRFVGVCERPIFANLNRWLTEVETQNWTDQLVVGPPGVQYTRHLAILNRPWSLMHRKLYEQTIPALLISEWYRDNRLDNGSSEDEDEEEDNASDDESTPDNTPETLEEDTARAFCIDPASEISEGDDSTTEHGEPDAGSVLISRCYLLDELFEQGLFIGNEQSSVGGLDCNQLSAFEWRHALPISPAAFLYIMENHSQTIQTLDITQLGLIKEPMTYDLFEACLTNMPPSKALAKVIIRAVDEFHGEPYLQSDDDHDDRDRLRIVRQILRRTHKSITYLRLSNEHIASQTCENIACRLPIEFDQILFIPDTASPDADQQRAKIVQQPCVLNLGTLELGCFNVQHLGATKTDLMANGVRLTANISMLRRLVLEDCTGIPSLLLNLTRNARRGKLFLTEFALRHTFPSIGVPGAIEADKAYALSFDMLLEEFLSSFKGLEVLSLLLSEFEGGEYSITYTERVWRHHYTTLKCLVSEMWIERPELCYTIPSQWGPYKEVGGMTRHNGARSLLDLIDQYDPLKLEELALGVAATDMHIVSARYLSNFRCCFMLRLLSQFTNLRAMHIRSFPPLPADCNWRNEEGDVTDHAIKTATQYANRIALPYYEHVAPDDAEPSTFFIPHLYDIDEKMAALHIENRDDRLAGLLRPDEPKLRLLVVGDWGYRDQMNLTGPRLARRAFIDYVTDSSLEGPWNDEEPWRHPSWSKQFLPIFFKVEWEWCEYEQWMVNDFAKIDEMEIRHRRRTAVEIPGWRAVVTVLPQTTVKGWPELPGGECKMFDFAWQD